jgi:type III secretion protein C
MKRAVKIILVVVLFLALPVLSGAAPVGWHKKPYSHFSQDEAITSLLMDFCASQGLRPVMDEGITGVVSGHFKDQDPRAFFDFITSTYNLFWYYDGTVMFIYPANKLASRIVSLEYLSTDRIINVLEDLGITDNRFPIRSVSLEKLLYLAGPERFVELAEQTARLMDEKAGKQAVAAPPKEVVRVFPLKYAWADDLTFNTMNGEVVVPGIATVLGNILSGKPTPGVERNLKGKEHTLKKLKGTGLNAKVNAPAQGEEAENSETQAPQPHVQAVIQADLRNNAVVVRDLEDRIPFYTEIIQTLDVPVGLVEIKVAIMDISKGKTRELGIRWRMKTGSGESGIRTDGGYDAKKGFGPDKLLLGSGLDFSTIIGNADEYFMAQVHAMEENDDAHILSQPSIVTLNNIEASLEHNTTLHVRLEGQEEVDLVKVSAGVVLRVTPHVIEDDGGNRIKLVVKIEDGSFLDAKTDEIPQITNSSINTQAVVAEGESLLIGGYTHERKTDDVEKVPILGDIPVLGWLFKSKSAKTEQTERLILLTPRILPLNAVLPTLGNLPQAGEAVQ